MNLSSQTAAGRSRSADGDAFLHPKVVHATRTAVSGPSTASPHAWKRVLQERIWSPRGPKGLAARSVLSLLLWYADANGRVWLGVQAIANKIGAGSLRTVRNAIESLAREGWLQSTPHTWATLTREQIAAGRPVPRRGDEGQAPNLYVLFDGCGCPASADLAKTNSPPRPGLARATMSKDSSRQDVPTLEQKREGRLGQKCQGLPPADLHHDPDPKRSRSRIESVERKPRSLLSTHTFSNVHTVSESSLDTWRIIVDAHASRTKQVYGLPPLPPDLKPDQQRAIAECLEGAALDVRAKWCERTGVEPDVHEVQRELATRVMQLYFKRDNEHLRRVKHALRDLPREFHARITEAMQLFLREQHDVTQPRQMQADAKFVETNDAGQRRVSNVSTDAAQVNTAHEARRLLDVLSAAQTRSEPTKQASTEHVDETRRTYGVREGLFDSPARIIHDKPCGQDKRVTHPEVVVDAGASGWEVG